MECSLVEYLAILRTASIVSGVDRRFASGQGEFHSAPGLTLSGKESDHEHGGALVK